MKKIQFIIAILFTTTIVAQTTVIDYSGLSSSDCNVFTFPTTINGVVHETTIGEPTLPNGAIVMNYDYGTGNQRGTGFKINFNFEVGYRYILTITARNGSSNATGATIQARFGSDGYNGGCSFGMGSVSNNGGQFFNPITSSTFYDYTIDMGILSSAQSIMSFSTKQYVGNTPNPTYQTFLIQKITIQKITPPMSFSLTPTSLAIPCSQITSPQTFTCASSNVPSGASVQYNWAVGNTWKIGGSPAPANVTTTTNSITLVPNGNSPANITVTPKVNGVNQPSMTCTVSLAPFTTTATITGTATNCAVGASANYTINAGTGNTVSWSVNNSVATVTASSNTGATLLLNSAGTFTLSATITNPCGQSNTLTRTINVGKPTFNGFTFGTSGSTRSICFMPVYNYSYSIPELNFTDKIFANFSGLTAAEASLSSNWEWQPFNTNIILNGSRNSRNICTIAAGQTGVRVRVKNSCGWSDWQELPFEIIELGPSWKQSQANLSYTISPNPSNGVFNINYNGEINENSSIEVYNLVGKKILSTKLSNDNTQIDLTNFSNGVYIGVVTNGDTVIKTKLIKQ